MVQFPAVSPELLEVLGCPLFVFGAFGLNGIFNRGYGIAGCYGLMFSVRVNDLLVMSLIPSIISYIYIHVRIYIYMR